MDKTVGILGGMGPEATAVFFNMLVSHTPAAHDQDHLKILVVNDPKIPDRTEHLLRGGPSPVPGLVKAARDLESIGADLIAIPCNTAHAFYAEISAAVSVPVLNIVTETVREATRLLGAAGSRVGIMSTQATLEVGLYQPALGESGLKAELPSQEIQKLITASITVLKGQSGREQASEWLTSAARFFKTQGCQAVLLACTELGLAPIRVDISRLDSLEILARATLRQALGQGNACQAVLGSAAESSSF